MKIGLFLTYDYSLSTWNESGTLERELKLFNELKNQKNVNFIIFTYGNEKDYNFHNFSFDFELVPIYSLIKYRKNSFLRYLSSFFIPLKLKTHIKKIDILHQNQLMGSWVTILCSLLYKKPLYIRTGYDMYTFAIYENKKKYIIKLYKLLTSLALKYASLYTVTSKSDFNFLTSNFLFDYNKLVLRKNWVKASSKNSLSTFSNRVLSVGRLCYQKNYEYLLSEFKNTNEIIQLDIVGAGENLEILENMAKNFNVKVNFLKKMDNSSLLDLYKEYKFYISPSRFEGNPKTVLEAMSSGCVVLVSNIPNHTEIVSNQINGILFDLVPGSLKSEFDKLFANQEKINSIKLNSIETVKKRYNLETLINKTFEDYINLSYLSSKK